MSYLLQQTSIWIVLLPLFTGLLLYQRLSYGSRIILYLTGAATPPQLIGVITNNDIVKNLFYNIYTPIEFGFVFTFFYRNAPSAFYKRMIRPTILVYILLSLLIVLPFGLMDGFLECWVNFNNLFYCFWILFYFLVTIESEKTLFHASESFFWYVFALFIYASSTSVFFAADFYTKSYDISLKPFHNIPNILMYMLFAVGFCTDDPALLAKGRLLFSRNRRTV